MMMQIAVMDGVMEENVIVLPVVVLARVVHSMAQASMMQTIVVIVQQFQERIHIFVLVVKFQILDTQVQLIHGIGIVVNE